MVADGSDWRENPREGIGACLTDAQNDLGYAEDFAEQLHLPGLRRAIRAAWRSIEVAQQLYRNTAPEETP